MFRRMVVLLAAVLLATAALAQQQQLGGRAFEELVGETIVADTGEEIGDINNFVVDDRNRTYAVVGIGGYLGLGARAVAIPVGDLAVGKERVRLKPGATVERLRALPEYRPGQYRSIVPGLGGGPPRREGRQLAD